jgi:hypothetical protein
VYIDTKQITGRRKHLIFLLQFYRAFGDLIFLCKPEVGGGVEGAGDADFQISGNLWSLY